MSTACSYLGIVASSETALLCLAWVWCACLHGALLSLGRSTGGSNPRTSLFLFYFGPGQLSQEENLVLFSPPPLYGTSPMHSCAYLSLWSFLGPTKAQLVQAGNFQFGSWLLPWGESSMSSQMWWHRKNVLSHDRERWWLLTGVCCSHQSCLFGFTLLVWCLLLLSCLALVTGSPANFCFGGWARSLSINQKTQRDEVVLLHFLIRFLLCSAWC